MTVAPRAGDVVRLDIRETDDELAVAALERLLRNPPDDLLGVLVVDTVDGLVEHEAFFERLGGSRQIESALVVAVGGIAVNTKLTIPASLRRDRGPIVIWVGDPVGSTWRLGSSSAARLTRPVPEKALARLLGVLDVPEIYQAVVALPQSSAASPGLSLFGDGDDEDMFLYALNRSLSRLRRGRDEPGRAQDDVRQALAALQAVVAPPGAQPELVAGGHLDQVGLAVRDRITELTVDAQSLVQPSSLFFRRGALARVQDTGARLADALSVEREACAALPEGVQAPGGGIPPGAIDARCTAAGLRLRPVGHPSTSPGRTVGQQVSSWLTRGVSLTDVDTRLRELERNLGSDTPARYRELIWQACPDADVQRFRTRSSVPPAPAAVLVAAIVTGLLAGFAGAGSIMATLALVALAVVVWAWPLANWPAISPTRSVLAVLAAVLVAGGGGLGYLGAKAAGPPVWIAVLSFAIAILLAVVTLSTTWRRASTEWSEALRIQDAETAHSRMLTCLQQLVVNEWAAAAPRSEAINTVILARAMTAGLESAAVPVLSALEPKVRAIRVSEQGGGYWSTVVDDQLRSICVAAMDPLWNHVTDYRPEALQHEVQGELERALHAWVDGGDDPLLRTPRRSDGAFPEPRLTGDAIDALISAVTVDAESPMWQLIAPDDLIQLSAKASDTGIVRVAPSLVVEEIGPDRLRHRVTPLLSSAYAGVLRLVPLRPSIVQLRWPVSVDLRDETAEQLPSPYAPRVNVTDVSIDSDHVADSSIDPFRPTGSGEYA
jgi:hypothetical protein